MDKPVFNLNEFGEDLYPILQKHGIVSIVGIAFDKGEGLQTFKFVEPGHTKALQDANAVFNAFDDILKVAGVTYDRTWNNVPFGGSKAS